MRSIENAHKYPGRGTRRVKFNFLEGMRLSCQLVSHRTKYRTSILIMMRRHEVLWRSQTLKHHDNLLPARSRRYTLINLNALRLCELGEKLMTEHLVLFGCFSFSQELQFRMTYSKMWYTVWESLLNKRPHCQGHISEIYWIEQVCNVVLTLSPLSLWSLPITHRLVILRCWPASKPHCWLPASPASSESSNILAPNAIRNSASTSVTAA